MAHPPSLRDKVPELSAAVEEVVMKALDKDPQQRFETVQAFAYVLDQGLRKDLAATFVFTDIPIADSQLYWHTNTIVLSGVETPDESFATLPNTPPEVSPSPPTTSLLKTPVLRQPETTLLQTHAKHRHISRRSVVIGLSGLPVAVASCRSVSPVK